jgi:hypothetical protein
MILLAGPWGSVLLAWITIPGVVGADIGEGLAAGIAKILLFLVRTGIGRALSPCI